MSSSGVERRGGQGHLLEQKCKCPHKRTAESYRSRRGRRRRRPRQRPYLNLRSRSSLMAQFEHTKEVISRDSGMAYDMQRRRPPAVVCGLPLPCRRGGNMTDLFMIEVVCLMIT